MTIQDRIALLRRCMAHRGLTACVVVTDDFHGSEYVGDHFKVREYLSGFTGSAGTLAVLPDRAALWTDGRYFLQAERQLEGSGIELMRAGQPDVPTLSAFLAQHLPEGGVLGFDGRTVSTRLYRTLEEALSAKHIRLDGAHDLAEEVWPDRPALSAQPLWPLESDVSRREKLSLLREKMAEKNAGHLLLTDLTDIAWTLNLRGGDVACTPVFLAFLLLSEADAVLFVQPQAVSPAIADALAADGVTLRPYGDIYSHLSALPAEDCVLLDSATANSQITRALAHARTVDAPSPAAALKAVKSPGEQDGFRRAHLLDGVALTRFLYRLKTAPTGLTEVSAAALLHELRAESEEFLEDSFDTIAAYGPHGAVVHYEPTAETDVPLEARGLLLCDSGGHYRGGTTDVTRTVALGPVSDAERRMCTLVLQGHIRLAMARFPKGVTGENLDVLARMPLWQQGLDYNHGTGHGVGCVLSVHESPPSFRWRIVENTPHPALETGMVISDEPGYYEAGQYGIRHESLLLVQPDGDDFLRFEVLTLAPFDRDALDVSLLSDEERRWLNDYHRRVREDLSPHLSAEERRWLNDVTQPL